MPRKKLAPGEVRPKEVHRKKPLALRTVRRNNWEKFIADEKEAREVVEATASAGLFLANIPKAYNFPHAEFFRWLVATPERKEWYERMKEVAAESLVRNSLEIYKEAERDDKGLLTAPGVNMVKAQSETMRWIAGKIDPKNWGDRDKSSVTINIDLANPFSERMKYREQFLERVDVDPK